MTEPNEIQQIRETMLVLCRAAQDADTSRRHPLFRRMTWAEMLASMGPFEAEVADLLENPIGRACRMALRLLGKRLYALGGRDAMRAACEAVAGSNAYRADMIDAAFDGIGEWYA